MAWPTNAALDALNDAALTYQELRGLDAMMGWLSHELSRLEAYRNVVTKRRAHAGIPAGNAVAPSVDAEHEQTLAAIDFYANPENYRTSKRKPVSAVMLDGGSKARARLAEIEWQGGEDEDESDA